MKPKITIPKKFEFSASHRYWQNEWDQEKNQEKFGLCSSPHGHGHNYELHVTIIGDIDPKTGMIINLTDLKKMVNKILKSFDHKFLNQDTPYFKDRIPTTENIALVLYELIENELEPFSYMQLYKIRLYERHDLFAEIWKKN